MKTKKSLFYVCMLMMACIMSAVSCVKEEHGAKVEEGLPASLKLSFSVPVFEDMPVTKAGAVTETQVQQLALIFYHPNDKNKPFFIKEINNLGNGQISGSDTHMLYTIEIAEDEGLMSGTYNLYAIANWGSGFCHIKYGDHDTAPGRFESLSLEDLKKEVISRVSTNNQLDLSGMTPMSGKFGSANGDGEITLTVGDNDFTTKTGGDNAIHLRRAVAKVEFEIKDGTGVTFTPESYSIYNFSQSSTLMERSGWDGSAGTKPGNLDYEGTGEFRNFEDLKFTEATPRKITFYMLENVQKAKTTADLTLNMREKRESEKSEVFKYAPEHSTYVVIKGKYSGPISSTSGEAGDDAKVEGDVVYTIQLGDFDATRGGVDNFTIRRNVKYTYTVTVNGVKSITTEAEAENFDDETRPGAEGDLTSLADGALLVELDAHYEKVLLRFPRDISNPSFFVNTPFSSTERKEGVTPDDETIPDDSKDCDWIKFSKPVESNGNISFGRFNNGKGLVNIHGLLKELKAGDMTHCVTRTEDGVEYVYTTAYVDEYFYEKNPIDGGSVALSDFINKPDRTMNICTQKAISVDGKSTYVSGTIILFRQNPIHTIYPLTGVDNPFGIEKKSEWEPLRRTVNITTGNLNDSDGWKNTRFLVTAVLGVSGKYDMKTIGYVFDAENATVPKYVTSSVTGDLRRPSIAAMSRNRDEDDSGMIEEDEMKWYMPARDQCLTLWMGNNDLGAYRPYNAEGLANSTNVEGPEGLIHTSSPGKGRVWWAIEGCSFGDQNNQGYVMRCVRNLNNAKLQEAPTTFSSCSNNIISVNGLSENSYRSSFKTGEYTTGHTERMVDNRVPLAFEVAKSDLVVSIPNPTITGMSSTVVRTSHTISRDYQYTVNLLIESVPAGATLLCNTGTLTAVSGEDYNYQVVFSRTTTLVGSSSGNFTINMKTVEGFESSGVSVDCNPDNSEGTVSFTPNVNSNDPNTYSTFTTAQIKRLTNLAAANYSQEADGSDKGQWRVPNQRELSLIAAYVGRTGGLSADSFDKTTDVRYTSSTFFTATKSGKTCPFHILNITNATESHMTLGTSDSYRIRPVRDVRTSTVDYDTQYGNGGTGFGIK